MQGCLHTLKTKNVSYIETLVHTKMATKSQVSLELSEYSTFPLELP